ncbi:MAG: UDP-N-acetylglucosamine 4,6-dehydratase [Firmicutes bacterium]|nr:UDP-N-acetylglucosamine 4,6-dehydratase [Bacillota bacterium]
MRSSYRPVILIIVDMALVYLSYIFAFIIRFEGKIPKAYLNTFVEMAFILIAIKIATFYYFGLYKNLWRYAGVIDVLQIIVAAGVANAVSISYLFLMQSNLPRSIYVLAFILDIFFIGGSRFGYRIIREFMGGTYHALNRNGQRAHPKKALIIGAGEAGAMVIREFRNHPELNAKPVAILDDDQEKHRRRIHGVPVLGAIGKVKEVARSLDIDEIIIAIPSAKKRDIRHIIDMCKDTRCKLRILPGVYELIDGKVDVKQIRDVQIEDLLGREPINLNIEEISGYLRGKVVLVTGGGGSIGSELCRQIARFNPRLLLILDIYENNAYNLQIELARSHPEIKTRILIASIRDKARLDSIFRIYNPQVVFHAAAHKHVPLMEDNPTEAIKNNVFGTLNVAECSDKYNVEKFVLISTDKAVNPTNVMGATKRIAEMTVQMMNKRSGTKYAAVRFGNVLGSSGSVIPLFKSQIAEGGPVTVTHPDITRYFMTIPEAAQLVIQAGAMAEGGEIFVLDMGEPIRIMDLAKDLIRLSGFEPGEDIPIEITKLRPGEKLYEELFMEDEALKATRHEKIFIGRPLGSDVDVLREELEDLRRLLIHEDHKEALALINKLVPDYRAAGEGGD